MDIYRLKAAVLAVVLLLTSCSETSQPSGDTKTASAEASAPPAPVSGKTAFTAMYKSARNWANDLQPLKLESQQIPGIKNEAGKAAMWSATFGSPSRSEFCVFTYAIAGHPPEIYKGVSVGHPQRWGGPTREVMPFLTTEIAVDSDTAYTTALAEAAAWVKKHPDKDVSLTLGNAFHYPGPVWYVLWGDNKLGYAVVVSAPTGTVLKARK